MIANWRSLRRPRPTHAHSSGTRTSGLARSAGVAEATIDVLRGGGGTVGSPDDVIVGFVQEMCATARVSDTAYAAASERLGTAGVVELTTLVGYYTMLAFAINVAESEGPVQP